MKRNLSALADRTFDLLVIGGGIHGACVAWEAVLRGLSVALVDKADFSSATSSNSLKIIHGGLRYVQQADVIRMRQSIRERTTLMRIAPHLVNPLPVLIPTYGHGMRGKEALSIALMINGFVGIGCHRLLDPQKRIPRPRGMSKREILNELPEINQHGLTGGIVFYDAQVYNSERLVLAFLRSAAGKGAELANYAKVVGFLRAGDRISGVEAEDVLTGDRFDIRAGMVVNTSGPWVDRVLNTLNGVRPSRHTSFAKAINVITRPIFSHYAVGLTSQRQYRDRDAVVNKGHRLLFVVPWRGRSLIGTTYAHYEGAPDEFRATTRDVQDLLDEFNLAYPAAGLKKDDVVFVHAGLLPRAGEGRDTDSVQLEKHYAIHDHRDEGIDGLLSVVGVKYTGARHVAQHIVDRIFQRQGTIPPKSTSSSIPVYGGNIERVEDFLTTVMKQRPLGIGENSIRRLVASYGSEYSSVLKCLDASQTGSRKTVDDCDVLRAEVRFGVREEMAQHLSDVVFRRTECGSAGYPGKERVAACAGAMRSELNWTESKAQQEIDEVNSLFSVVS